MTKVSPPHYPALSRVSSTAFAYMLYCKRERRDEYGIW
jgi:hypothetical protein